MPLPQKQDLLDQILYTWLLKGLLALLARIYCVAPLLTEFMSKQQFHIRGR